MMDGNACDTYDYALNDVFKLIGLQNVDKELFDNIDRSLHKARVELYRYVIGLVLGTNFREERYIFDSMISDYLSPKVDDTLEELKTRTDCTLIESINTYIYLCLELHEYSRLDRITLDNRQDPKELFLAMAFLISKDNWFEFCDRHGEEVKRLKDVIVEFASKELDLLNITSDDLNVFEGVGDKSSKLNGDIKKDNKTNTERLFRDYLKDGKKPEDNEYLDNLIKKKEQFEEYIVQLASDITLKATLLSRRKTVSSYDSELLRIIMGRSEYEKDFLRIIDDITSNKTDLTKELLDKALYNEEFSDEIKDIDEWENLIREIINYTNIIIQLQFKLRDLSNSIEDNDRERLKYFSKITETFKSYEKKEAIIRNDRFISDRYKQPSPVEFLLISDEHLFRRHMSIMEIINKALDNEIRRKNFWIKALEILSEIEGEGVLDEPGESIKFNTNNNLLSIYSKPSDIKYNVHVLKSFVVEGIPTENFSVQSSDNESNYYKSSKDFLRQVNVKFANFKAGQISDKHGRKTTFSMFIMDEVYKAKMNGQYSDSEHDELNEKLKQFFHLSEDVDLKNAKLQFPLMSKWIDGTENFESITRGSPSRLNESIVDSISDTNTLEYERLDNVNFRIIDNMVQGKKNKAQQKPKPTIKDNSLSDISDIVDYNYYFNLCRENYNITKETEVNCFGFSNEIEKIISDATECTTKNMEKSKNNLDQISELIKDNTKLYVIY